MKKYAGALLVVTLMLACSQKSATEGIVKIGNKIISKDQMDAFEKVSRMYPTDPGTYFPAYRAKITHLIETEILFDLKETRSLKDSLKKSADWQWKQRYFPAQLYLTDFLVNNLGVSDEKIAQYYEANKDSFMVTIKAADSTKEDSSYCKPLEDVKNMIAEKLFIKSDKPDSAFLARFDSTAEQRDIDGQWLQYVRQNLPAYFMKKLYSNKFGKPFPDSLSDIFGEGKYITEADYDMIMNWIPESRRNYYSAPERKRELVEWLLKWKLFSEIAESEGRSNQPLTKNILEWAWKCNVVYTYINQVIEPKLDKMISIDSSMTMYALYDDNGYNPVEFSSHSFENKILSIKRDRSSQVIDSIIRSYRLQKEIVFLQNDWKDNKNESPAALLEKADALRDSGKTTEAKDAYSTLTQDFVFTPEGQKALVELAKLETEQQLYSQAIKNYRNFLLYSNDDSKRCNTFFMIGFIYDEYLDKPLHAEANYKWVLKNSPDCELADDAEFMMLHLNEPMSSVEELRDEAKRQGRKVDPVEDETAPNESGKPST